MTMMPTFVCFWTDMQEAWRERESIDRIFRAHEALEANKHCAVAWIIVAEEQAEKVEKAEQIFKIALKVAENNYQRNALTLTGSEIHEIPVNEVPSSSSASSYRSTRSGCFNHGSASTSSSQTYNFMFHDVDDQLNKLLNELRSDLGLETSVHTKTDKQQSKDTKSEKFRINDKTSLPISGFISNFGKILPTPANQLLFEELKRDLNVIVYIKRRLAMCLRKMGQLKEAVKMYKDLTKEFPLVNALNIHENLIEVYLEMGAYTDAQNVLTKYDG